MLEQSYNRVITRQRYLEQSSYRSRFAFESAKLLSVTRQTKCRPFIVCKHSIDTIVFDDHLSLLLFLSVHTSENLSGSQAFDRPSLYFLIVDCIVPRWEQTAVNYKKRNAFSQCERYTVNSCPVGLHCPLVVLSNISPSNRINGDFGLFRCTAYS